MNTAEEMIKIFRQSADLLIGIASHDITDLSEKMSSIYKDTFTMFFNSKVRESLTVMNGNHYINKLYGKITGNVPCIDESFIDVNYPWREDTIDVNYLDTLRYIFHTESPDELVYKPANVEDGYMVTIRLIDNDTLEFKYSNSVHGNLYVWGYTSSNEPTPVFSTIYTENEPLYFTPSLEKQHEVIETVVKNFTGYEIDHDIHSLYFKAVDKAVAKYGKDNLPITLLKTDHIELELIEQLGTMELGMYSSKAYKFNHCILNLLLEELK